MARRQKAQQHENHERWLVSYADFITLLFAFFVVMFASSHADKQKAKQLSASVKEAFEVGMMPKAMIDLMGRKRPPMTDDKKKSAEKALPEPVAAETIDPAAAAMAELVPSLDSLKKELSKEIGQGKVTINMEPRGLVVSLKEAAFFPPADDKVNVAAMDVIGKIAESARALPNKLLLEGHTDATPIHNERFRSNWDLSTSRSIAMLELMSEKYGIPLQRLSVSGYADTVPVASNDTVEGRKKNRRVDIVFLNEYGQKSQPGGPVKKPEAKKPSAMQ